jgi:uncharacterized protein (DUF305 family)
MRLLLVVAATFVIAATALAGGSDETAFLAENNTAMKTMMAAMAIEPSGDVDRDFVAMMVPHHQGAIEMAQALLRHGRNEQLRRIAQEIIVTQQQEIAAMRLALGEPPSSATPAPAAPSSVAGHPSHAPGVVR